LFARKLAFHFFTIVFHFMLHPDPNPVPQTGCTPL
jgi:hypothetical protein